MVKVDRNAKVTICWMCHRQLQKMRKSNISREKTGENYIFFKFRHNVPNNLSSYSWRKVATVGPQVPMSFPFPAPAESQPRYSRQTWAINNAKYGVQKTQKKEVQRKWGNTLRSWNMVTVMEWLSCRLCRSWDEAERQKTFHVRLMSSSWVCLSPTPWDWEQLGGINNAQYGVRTRLLHCRKQRTDKQIQISGSRS